MKGQVVADFIVDHGLNTDEVVHVIRDESSKLFFDGSVCNQGQGVGCVIVSPHGVEHEVYIWLEFECTNNQAEYEALFNGLEMLVGMGVRKVEILGDSKLVVQQITGDSQCIDGVLNKYRDKCVDFLGWLENFVIKHISGEDNEKANSLAQQASGYIIRHGKFEVHKRPVSYIAANATMSGGESAIHDYSVKGNWRQVLIRYLEDPNSSQDRKVRRRALKYTIIDGVLYRRTIEGLLLRCLGPEGARIAMGEVHEGMCGAHQAMHKMKWMLRRVGVFWPTILKDCFEYYKGCVLCQKFGKIQMAPASMLHPIIRPWPFRGWGLDFIGKIHPSSAKGHQFVLVATDYFTKWVEEVSLRNMKHREVIGFVTEHIVHRFGIPQTMTTDQGPAFMSWQFREFAASLSIKLLNLSPYYAQANGQAEASNKILVGMIKKE
jgi:ribonuclease HI